MSMKNLKEYKAFKARFALVVSDERYARLVDQDGKEVLFTPNPAVYRGTSFEVRWDDTAKAWVPLRTPSPLEDSYGRGDYLLTRFPAVFGAVGDSIVKLDAAGNFADPLNGTLRLELAYAEAAIHPVLIIKVYEARLASHDYVAYIGPKLDDTNAATYLGYSEEELINALATDFVTAAQAAYDAAYGAGNVTITYDPATKTFGLDGLVKFDGMNIYGEKYNEVVNSAPHLSLPAGRELILTVPISGYDAVGIRPLRGVYMLFNPDKIQFFPVVLEHAIDALTTISAADKERLKREMRVTWVEWFNGSQYTFKYQGKEVTANVFLSVLTSDALLATITIEDPANPGNFIDVVAMPISLQDAVSFEPGDKGLKKAWPDGMQYVTGPYGALPIRDPATGDVIAYFSDAYTK